MPPAVSTARAKTRLKPTAPALQRAGAPASSRHALFAPVVVNVFEHLDVGVTLWEDRHWFEIYERSAAVDLLSFELEHGVESERVVYNLGCVERALSTRQSVVAQHSGFTDLFVPIPEPGRGVLVTGPFQTTRATSADLLERWRLLTGAQGRLSDPEFARYVETTASTLMLEGGRGKTFQELVELLAALCGGRGDADEIFTTIQSMYGELAPARLADKSWEIARSMVDQRTSRAWASPHRSPHLAAIGLSRFPDNVLVGLIVGAEAGADPLEELLTRDGFQRAVVELASAAGGVTSGRIGGHGITLLSTGRGSAARTRRFLMDLGDQAIQLARRKFGLRLHLGVSTLSQSIAEQYGAALSAAEAALAKGVRVVQATSEPVNASPLGPMRRELSSLVDERPQALPARFERYLEAVAIRSSHRLDVARAHVEAGFERIAEAFRDSGALELKSFTGLNTSLDHAAGEAVTLTELFAAYRRAVHDIVDVVSRPTQARRDRSLQRAEEYLRTHYAEPLSLSRVAHVAGFAPSYFSELFRVKQGVTFERYLMQLRVERAKQLLSGTTLNLQRIAQLAGFSTRHYLGRVFKRVTGETPLGYRERVREQRSPERLLRSRRNSERPAR